jgi:hypothetical protein
VNLIKMLNHLQAEKKKGRFKTKKTIKKIL